MLPAPILERHSSLCRSAQLPDTAPPGDVRQALLQLGVFEAAKVEADAAADRWTQMVDWRPAPPAQHCPFTQLKQGNYYEHYAAWGGRGSGKSYGAADAIVAIASTQKERVAAAREFMKRIRDSSKALLEATIKQSKWARDWESTEYELRNTVTGSVIIFLDLNGNDAESVGKSLEGVTMLWADEAQLLSQRSIDVMLPTIRDLNSRCVWTWNPGEQQTPIDKLFRGEHLPERATVACKLVEDNPYLFCSRLPSEMRGSFARDDEGKYRHIWRGAHLTISERNIFKNVIHGYFDFMLLPCRGLGPHVHDLGGIDFGYGGQDPSACVRLFLIQPEAFETPDITTRPVLYIYSEAVQRNVPNHELVKLVRQCGLYKVLCDAAMPLMISALEGSGIVAEAAAKGAGSVLAGLRKMQSCQIIISPACPIAYSEITSLLWAADKQTNEITYPLIPVGSKHCVDAVRYAISETELEAYGTNDSDRPTPRANIFGRVHNAHQESASA